MAKKEREAGEAAYVQDYAILLGPVITEKASTAGGVVFKVHPKATKTEIKEAIERVFKVRVAKIATANYMGKPKRTARSAGRRANYKKAYVTLKEGQQIEIIEGL